MGGTGVDSSLFIVGRAWHTATVLDHEPWLLVLGGENCSKESGERQFLSSLEALDLASKVLHTVH